MLGQFFSFVDAVVGGVKGEGGSLPTRRSGAHHKTETERVRVLGSLASSRFL